MKLLIQQDGPPRFVRDDYQTDDLIVSTVPGLKAEDYTRGIIINLIEREYGSQAAMKLRVDDERDRRTNGTMLFEGVSFQTRPQDRENIAGAATAALGAMVNGAQAGDLRWHGGDTDFVWIATDNTTMAMDAQTMFAFGQSAMAHKQAHIFAARALKDADPVPADYAEDAYWP